MQNLWSMGKNGGPMLSHLWTRPNAHEILSTAVGVSITSWGKVLCEEVTLGAK